MAKAAKRLYLKIEKIEAKEKKGVYGIWRREFCGKYIELLIKARQRNYTSFIKTITSQGKTISCRKECTSCCFHYVATPLAHGLAIVDYLYNHKDVLKKFVHNYLNWRRYGYALSRNNDHARNQAFSNSMPIEDIIEITRPFSMEYLQLKIPCPFLEKNRCLIYEVRPLPCSGQFSVSPPNWCSQDSENQPEIYQLVPEDKDLLPFLQLADPRLMLYEITLPIMVYKLLTEGVSTFENILS